MLDFRKSKTFAVLAFLTAVFSSLLIAKLKPSNEKQLHPNNLDRYLQNQLGDRFQKTAIEEIYIAGPNKTIICS